MVRAYYDAQGNLHFIHGETRTTPPGIQFAQFTHGYLDYELPEWARHQDSEGNWYYRNSYTGLTTRTDPEVVMKTADVELESRETHHHHQPVEKRDTQYHRHQPVGKSRHHKHRHVVERPETKYHRPTVERPETQNHRSTVERPETQHHRSTVERPETQHHRPTVERRDTQQHRHQAVERGNTHQHPPASKRRETERQHNHVAEEVREVKDEDNLEEKLLELVLKMSLREHNRRKEKETGEQAGEWVGRLRRANTATIPAPTPRQQSDRCFGCFWRTTGTQAPCGCRYCPDCLAGIFIQALDAEEFYQPRCCGQIFPMELAAPILAQAGIEIPINRGGGGKGKDIAGGARPERTVDCLICMESVSTRDVIKATCQHDYCRPCMKRLFIEATKTESLYPPKCCDINIPLTVANTVLNTQEQTEFYKKGREFQTTDRLYCSAKDCWEFIPPQQIRYDIGTCGHCRQLTCGFCKGPHHRGDCPRDKDTQALLRLAQQAGWRRCLGCKSLVELNDGCNHITCKCGAEFCYTCGAKWRTCACARYTPENLARAIEEVAENRAEVNRPRPAGLD